MDKVVHFKILADNLERAKKFYATVFGWNTVGIPQTGYTLLHTGPTDKEGMTKENGFINGGMQERQKPVESVVITINVKDIEETAKRIKANGDKMIRDKMKVGDMGYAAYFKDSEGNIVGLWQNAKQNQ